MDISEYIARVQKLNFTEIIAETLKEQTPALLEAQQKQMQLGKRADGRLIGKYRGTAYKRKKFALNPLAGYGNVDLALSKEFYRGQKIYFFSTGFFFTSTDFKTLDLVKKYGEDIFGFNNKTVKELSLERITPDAIKKTIYVLSM